MSLTATVEMGATHATMTRARAAQLAWAAQPLRDRLATVRRLRHAIASNAETLAATVPLSVPGSLHRQLADTLVAEVLPLAEACRFLEREAEAALRPRKLSKRSRPFFLRRVQAVVERVPYGVVLVLGPANYPLFLPAVQVMQALVAGNAVLWKPAATGAAAARLLCTMLIEAGLPRHLVTILDTHIGAAQSAIAGGVDKVALTGHISTGHAVLKSLAETATPAVMELSGCDAVFVLPGADLEYVARAVAFGLRLNGSATCMAPRRLFVAASEAARFQPLLTDALRSVPAVSLSPRVAEDLEFLLEDARRQGAVIFQEKDDAGTRPAFITGATSQMRCMQTDIFAPLVSMAIYPDIEDALEAHRACPYALTASLFGPEQDAVGLARQLSVGTVLINDIIVATADPRLPFGGRGRSGLGVTRGREGLLEMTAIRTVAMQRSRDHRAYAATTDAHVPFFSAYIRAAHAGTWRERLQALRAFGLAARRIPADKSSPERSKRT